MASGKKKVTQSELRRLMSEHKGKMPKKIVSPLAKYSNKGVLSCTLCNTTIVSEMVWEAHTKCRKHLDNLQRLRDAVRPSPAGTPAPIPAPPPETHVWKRPAPAGPLLAPPEKKIKGILKNAPKIAVTLEQSSHSDGMVKISENVNQANNEANVISCRQQEKNSKAKGKGVSESTYLRESDPQGVSASPTLPENFFDSPAAVSFSTQSKLRTVAGDEVRDSGNPDDAIPEGFFDDPQLDAKARNIEYKNPVEEEWERFRKEIKEQTSVSAQIIAEDQDEATVDRQIDEIDEQMRNWTRVLELEVKKEKLDQNKGNRERGGGDSSSDDENEFQEYLDWRVKKA